MEDPVETLNIESDALNCMELLAATPARKTFATKKNRTGISILHNNTTAVSYIKYLEGQI